MHQIEESVRIDRPPEEWAAIADYSFDLQWRRGITEMSPDPPGPPEPGTRVHEVLKLAGRRFTTDSTVSEVDPGASYRLGPLLVPLLRSGLQKDLKRLKALLER